jgi:hypothetical protein
MATMSTRVINNKVIISHANIEVHIVVIRDHKVQKHTGEDIKTITKMKIIEVTGAGVLQKSLLALFVRQMDIASLVMFLMVTDHFLSETAV